MNLVAKEYVAAQDAADPGVLILSRFAGAAAEFREGALLVNPYDPEAVGAAIAMAMAMPLAERKGRHAALYAQLLRNDISRWGDKFPFDPDGHQKLQPEGSRNAQGGAAGLCAANGALKRGIKQTQQATPPAAQRRAPAPIPS